MFQVVDCNLNIYNLSEIKFPAVPVEDFKISVLYFRSLENIYLKAHKILLI